jgi:uncharacterized membrane protein
MHAWHPLLVHFPLGLLLSGVALEAVGWLSGRSGARQAALWLLTAGVLAALPAIATGLLAYGRVDHSDAAHALMTRHRNLALGTVALFVLAVIWRWSRRSVTGGRGSGGVLYGGLLAVATAGLVTVGDLGADLVFGHAVGVPSERLEDILRERHEGHEHAHGGKPEASPGMARPDTADARSEESPAGDSGPAEDHHHGSTP